MLTSKTEPIRLTNWVAALASAVIGAAIVYIQSNDWKAAALSALTAGLGLVGAAEVARNQVVSPETLEKETGRTLEQLKK